MTGLSMEAFGDCTARTSNAGAAAGQEEWPIKGVDGTQAAGLQESAWWYHDGTKHRDRKKIEPPPEVQIACSQALQNRDRDGTRGAAALVNLWREVSKPNKQGAVAAKPAGCKDDSRTLFEEWCNLRGLSDALKFDREEKGWHVYRYTRQPAVASQSNWETAFHGTWWYAVWSILDTGVFLESNDRDLGHDFWEPGVYCSPSLDTGLWYARPQIMFADGVFHRIIFELRVDPEQKLKDRKRGGVQWVFPSSGVSLHAVWIFSNAPPNKGEERVNEWDPQLEALPSWAGSSPLPATVNLREGPWEDRLDPFPFETGDQNAPPWMQGPGKNGDDAGLAKMGLTAMGGPYGHWLKKARNGELHQSFTAKHSYTTQLGPKCVSAKGQDGAQKGGKGKKGWAAPGPVGQVAMGPMALGPKAVVGGGDWADWADWADWGDWGAWQGAAWHAGMGWGPHSADAGAWMTPRKVKPPTLVPTKGKGCSGDDQGQGGPAQKKARSSEAPGLA